MRRSLLTLATLFALLAVATTSAFASGKAVLDDCTDDERMSKTYSQKDYRDALGELAADTDQYGNCRDVIRRAMLAAAGSRKKTTGPRDGTGDAQKPAGKGGAVGSEPADKQLSTATPKERSDVDEARKGSDAPFVVDNATVDPAKVGRVPAVSQVTNLPTPIVVLLALLLAGLLAAGAWRIRSLVHARRG